MNAIDRLFGVSPQALAVRTQRFEMISANLANSDTPGYKAVDIDFGDAMAKARAASSSPSSHFRAGSTPDVKYRMPAQPSVDGNTVETEQEHSAFMDNAIRYQASLNFLDGRIKSILMALRGE